MLFPCAEQIQLLNIINWILIGLRELGWISDGESLRKKIGIELRHKLDKFSMFRESWDKNQTNIPTDDHCVVLNYPKGIFTITLPIIIPSNWHVDEFSHGIHTHFSLCHINSMNQQTDKCLLIQQNIFIFSQLIIKTVTSSFNSFVSWHVV